MKDFNFKIPQNIQFGMGSLKKLPEILAENHSDNILLVSDRGLEKIGVVKKVQEIIEAAGLKCTSYLDVVPNPTVAVVNEATALYKECGATSIVALGGGSSMDVGKAVGVLVNYGGKITDYEGNHKVPGPIVPMIAIPTTAGTGSEVTASAVITDTERNYKLSVFSYEILPKYAVLDPELIMTAPTSIAASCGVDALIHAMEAYVSRNATPFSDAMAEKAMELIGGNLRRFVANSIWLTVFFAAIMSITVCILCRSVLIAMKTPADILDLAYDYIFIIFAGIPITLAYNLLTGIIRSLGDSKSPLIFLLMAAVANIGFDILSVTVLKLGVRGPAFATLLAQAFSVVLSLWCIKTKFPILKMEPGEWKLHGKHIGILCKMGIPMGLQYSITAIGSVVLQTGINTLGSAAVASVSAASKLSMFLACPFDAIGSAMATYTGQNVGAGKIERIGQGLKASVLIGITYSILIFLVMLFSAKYWMLLFINASETEIIHNAVLFILANSGFYIALVFVNAVRFTIQGAGFSGLAILAGVMEMIARAIIGVIMVPYLGFASVCFASPLAWIMADCFLIPAYCHVIRKLKQRRAQGVPNM